MKLKPMVPTLPLAERVADEIERTIIRERVPGERLPSLRTLAGQLAVSVSTLQSALAVLRQRGLVESRQGSGVYVAERQTAMRIGIYSELDLFDPRFSQYFRTVAGGLRARLAKSGAVPQLYVGHAEPGPGARNEPTCPEFWEDVANGRLDGAVVLNVPSSPSWKRRMAACPVPVIGGFTGYDVTTDLVRISAGAVKHLASEGCRRLGLISWHGEEHFRRTVAEAGLHTCDAWIRADLDPSARGAGWDHFREIWAAGEGRPDGLVILDDMLFADAQMAMFELGVQVPSELRLTVFANREITPPIRLPARVFEVDPQDAVVGFSDLILQRVRGELAAPRLLLLPFREYETAIETSGATVREYAK